MSTPSYIGVIQIYITMRLFILTTLLLAATFTQAQYSEDNFWEENYNLFYGEYLAEGFVAYDMTAPEDAYCIMVVRIVSEDEHVPYALRSPDPESRGFHFYCPGEFYAVALDEHCNDVSIPWYFTIDDDTPSYRNYGATSIELK